MFLGNINLHSQSANIDYNPKDDMAGFNDGDFIKMEIKKDSNKDILESFFNKPILNLDVIIDDHKYYNSVIEILNLFGMTISENDIKKINELDYYKIVKLYNNDISLHLLCHNYDQLSIKLSSIEYTKNSNSYIYKLSIGTSKENILRQLGQPDYISEKRDIFIYYSYVSYKQINIYFENGYVKKIQFIASDGE
jgi:hypothetical protein